MTMTVPQTADELVASFHDTNEVERVETKAIALMQRAEIEVQLDAAHRYPRSASGFIKEAMALSCMTQDIAESCIYALPRKGKQITGPSIRLAEICASTYKNLRVESRIVDVTDKEVVARGVAFDAEKNYGAVKEVRRRIVDKNGRRYNDDMITMTGNAAAAIALRNAIFTVIPRAYVDVIYAKVRNVAVGDAQTFAQRREDVVGRLGRMGVDQERLLARLERRAVEDVTLEDLEVLIGLGTSITQGNVSIDDAFPAATNAPLPKEQDGKRVRLPSKTKQNKTVQLDDHTGEVLEQDEPGSNG